MYLSGINFLFVIALLLQNPMSHRNSFDLEKPFFPKKGEPFLAFRGEQSSILNSSAETLRRNLRDETRFALEYSNKYICLSLFISISKLIASSYVFLSDLPLCLGILQIWVILMMCYDISHVCLVISRLKNIKELDEELSSLHKIPQTHDQNFTLTYNPQENLLDLVNNQTPSKKEIQPSLHNIAHHNHHEERITPKAIHILRRRRIIARISKISQIYYFLLLVFGQITFLAKRPDNCDKEEINILVIAYLALAYLWFLGPTLLLLISVIFLPVLLIFLCIFGRKNQMPAKNIDINKLPTIQYSHDLQGDTICAICVLDYHEGENVIQLPCNPKHYFHEGCLKKWLKMNGQCPICRLRIDAQYPPEGGMDGKSPELQTSEKH